MADSLLGAARSPAVCSPLTRRPEVTLLQTLPADRLIEQWCAHYDLDVTAELRGCRELRLYECNRTGLRFFQPGQVAGSGTFYAALEQFPWYYLADKWEHRRAQRDLARAARSESERQRGTSPSEPKPRRDARAYRVLEVGSGRGEFVAGMSRTPGMYAEGIELNAQAVAEAHRQGLPVFAADLYHFAGERPGEYDAVCAFQVVEHAPDTADFLDALLRLLRPGGQLILSVPNQRSALADPAAPLDQPPHHMTRWDAAVLGRLPNWFPIRLRHLACEPLASYHVAAYVARRAALSRGPARLRRAQKLWWRRVAAPVLQKSALLRATIRGHALYARFERLGDHR